MRFLIFAVLVAVTCLEVHASCYALLFQKGITIFEKENLRSVVYTRKGPTIAIPQTDNVWGINNISTFTVRNDCKGTYFGQCTDLPSRRGQVIKVIALDVDQVCWHSGYVRVSDCDIFAYTPLLPRQSMGAPELQISCLTEPAAKMLDGERAKSFQRPVIRSEIFLSTSFDKAWQAIIETLSESSIPIKTIDKSSGLILSEEISDSRKDISACPYELIGAVNLTFNIFVKTRGDTTVVKINTSISGIRDDKRVTCYSNGKLESNLFDRIAQIAGNQ